MDDALRIDVGRAHLVDAAGVVRRVGHHEHPDPTTGPAGGKLPPQRPRHRRGVLEHLVGELRRHENEQKNQESEIQRETNRIGTVWAGLPGARPCCRRSREGTERSEGSHTSKRCRLPWP